MEEDEREERFKEFSIEVKRMVRNSGKSNMIAVSDLDELIIKYNIK